MSRQLHLQLRCLRRLCVSAPAALALALFVAACNKGRGAPPPPLFNNPGDVAMACFDRQFDPKRSDGDVPVVLPRHCCDSSYVNHGVGDPLAADAGVYEACGERVDPVPHALLTQTIRGEIAAVDLLEDEVIDGDRSIPGYTFVDVGGEPTAIVVPPAFPCPASLDPEQQKRGCGAPEFTFVSGREQDEVRAIPTCRFRMGRRCGPDQDTRITSDLKVVPLAGEPRDMVLDPGGRALWISLPERGLLARVALGTHDPDDPDAPLLPFEVDADGKPKEPEYFPLSSGLDLTPPEPVLEPDPYVFTCGLGYKFEPGVGRLRLPFAPRMVSQKRAHPTRMQFADVGDGAQTLLVVDDGQAVVHALHVADEGPSLRAVLPVGAPLRDFAVTPGVPALAPAPADLVKDEFYYTPNPEPDVVDPTKDNSKRYLYGIDGRDGSVMVFDLTLNAGVPSLTPLLVPAPARDTLRRFANFGDRIGVGGDGAFSARTLAVLDTRQRLLPNGERDQGYCGEFDNAAIDKGKQDAAASGNRADQALWAYREEVLSTGMDDRAYEALRGVFLLITGSSGVVAVIDVHNLDLQCRARASCNAEDPDQLGNGSVDRGVALQRHAIRLSGIEAASTSISSEDDLESDGFFVRGDAGEGDAGAPLPDGEVPPQPDVDGGAPDAGDEPGAEDAGGVGGDEDEDAGADQGAMLECPVGYYKIDDAKAFVCAAADPWRARPITWSAVYRGPGAGFFTGALDEDENGIFMQAPEGLDFCERGVWGSDFALVITSKPRDDTPEYCERDADEPWRLLIREAYQDRLVLELDPEVTLASGEVATLEDLRRCFSDFAEFQLRFADAWRVLVGDATYTHRVMTGPDGLCVIDEEIDPRWQARTDPSLPYVDPYIAFQLREPEDRNDRDSNESISPSITLDVEGSPVTMQFTSGPRFDTLPIRMRFFPETGYLFVVDAASQGITSLFTFPKLEVDETYH